LKFEPFSDRLDVLQRLSAGGPPKGKAKGSITNLPEKLMKLKQAFAPATQSVVSATGLFGADDDEL
jgi:hypothetical protein